MALGFMYALDKEPDSKLAIGLLIRGLKNGFAVGKFCCLQKYGSIKFEVTYLL